MPLSCKVDVAVEWKREDCSGYPTTEGLVYLCVCVCVCVCVCTYSDIHSCLTLCGPWTVACQAPLSMEPSRQEYWSRLPFPSPGDVPNAGLSLGLLYLLHWWADSLPLHQVPCCSKYSPQVSSTGPIWKLIRNTASQAGPGIGWERGGWPLQCKI